MDTSVKHMFYCITVLLCTCMLQSCQCHSMNMQNIIYNKALSWTKFNVIEHISGSYIFLQTGTSYSASILCILHFKLFHYFTGCSNERPTVANSRNEQSFDPPKISFFCNDGYTSVGSISSSTCVPGSPWSPVNFTCFPGKSQSGWFI